MPKTIEREIAEALDRELRGWQVGVKRLADLMGCDESTIHRWCAGAIVPPSGELLRLVQMVGTRDPERATRLLNRILGLIGRSSFVLPTTAPAAGDVLNQTADVPENATDYQRTVRNAAADGVITPEEAAGVAKAKAKLYQETEESHAAVVEMAEKGGEAPLATGVK